MYRINPLQRNVLITTDEVIFHAPTKNTVDARAIEQSIIIAEERFIRPALGYEYYSALLAAKNTLINSGNKVAQQALVDAALPPGSKEQKLKVGDILNASEYLSANDLALWKQILWKLTAEAVMLLVLPEGFVQFGSEGTIHNQPSISPMGGEGKVVTPDLRSVKWMMDKKMQDRIDPLRESLHTWLCQQKKSDKTLYPLYTKHCDCDINGVAYKRKTDVLLGLYDDQDWPYDRVSGRRVRNDRNDCCD